MSFLCKLLTSAKDTDDLSNCFERSLDRKKQELTNNKKQKGNIHLRIMLLSTKKAAHRLGNKLVLTRNSDNSVLNKDKSIIIGKVKINIIELHVPHYTHSIPQQAILTKQFLSKTPTEFQYVERSVFLEEVYTQNFWSFELETQEGINIPIWIITSFQQRKRRDS